MDQVALQFNYFKAIKTCLKLRSYDNKNMEGLKQKNVNKKFVARGNM